MIHHDAAALFVADVTAAYGHSCLFFHDRYGGDVVAVVMDPQAVAAHPLKVATAADVMPVAAVAPAAAQTPGKKKGGKKQDKAAAEGAAAADDAEVGFSLKNIKITLRT